MGLMDKLMEKKSSKPLDPMYKDAKMSMLHELRNAMSGEMKNDLENAKGMKKVTVAGTDPAAVAEGLDKAKEMVSGEGSEDESQEDPSAMMNEMSDLSPEKIDMLIEMLQKKKDEMIGTPEDLTKPGMV